MKSCNAIYINKLLFAFAVSAIIFIMIPSHNLLAQNEAPDDETCLTCHENKDRSLIATPHRLGSQTESPRIEVKCSSCHKGGENHIEDPSPKNITNPAKLISTEAINTCTQCHKAHDQLDNYGFDAHSIEQLSCADCHKVHGGPSQLLDDSAEFCMRCHAETRMSFKKFSSHPVLQGNVTCLSCHRFTKRQNYKLAYDLSGTCRECHPEQSGPFPYEHEAMNAYSVEGGGCTECHEPHGSENDRLLKQPGNQLCRQCHFPAGHETAHDGIWAKYACQQCHTDTHGSFVSNLYLDPNLPAKFSGDCFNSGCHSLNK